MTSPDPNVFVRMRTSRAMHVPIRLDLRWNDAEASVAHPSLCHEALGKALDSGRRSSQHCHFHAAFVVEGHSHRGDCEVVMILEGIGQFLGQVARASITQQSEI